jgi:hypothetical protein
VSKLKPSRGYFSFRGFIMAEEVRDSLNSMRSPPWKNGLRGDLWYAKTQSDKTAVESHLLLQIIVGQVTAMTIRVEPMVEMDLVQVRGDDLLAQFMRLRAYKRHVPAS